jgi:nitrogen fixation NifU-like protein
MSDAVELFQAVIDDHRRRPRHRGSLAGAHRCARAENPRCGDQCTVELRLAPGEAAETETASRRVEAASFTGSGCALSQASTSIATVALTGLDLGAAMRLVATVERLLLDPERTRLAEIPELPPEVATLAAVRSFPARRDCALVGWRAARAALDGPDLAG